MMKRREFVGLAVAAAASPHYRPGSAVMAVGCQRGPTSDEMLSVFARNGVAHCCGYPDTYDSYGLSRLIERGRRHGVSVVMVELPLPSAYIARAPMPNIMLGRSPERDREIDRCCEIIRTCARAGIPALKYNFTILGVLSTEPSAGRGGVLQRSWDLSRAKQEPPLTEAGPAPADVMWDRIEYFLKRVVPVANEYKIRLACHPHDPGVPPAGFRGVDRVLGTVEGLKRFISIEESPYHGLNFCQGTVSEMLQDPGREIFDVIRYFGHRKKIFNVHFRNIRGRRDNFVETYPDEGDVNMYRAMLVYKEVGYPYMIMPDHMPRHPADPGGHQAFSFAYGYIKALIQACSQA